MRMLCAQSQDSRKNKEVKNKSNEKESSNHTLTKLKSYANKSQREFLVSAVVSRVYNTSLC